MRHKLITKPALGNSPSGTCLQRHMCTKATHFTASGGDSGSDVHIPYHPSIKKETMLKIKKYFPTA